MAHARDTPLARTFGWTARWRPHLGLEYCRADWGSDRWLIITSCRRLPIRHSGAMDSRLAAVLGATVGALGTGATCLAAALLARTARHQVQVENMRALRESRRATYLAFAETPPTRRNSQDLWIKSVAAVSLM